ncbi:MAG: 6-carboxytetrahydropterin synthase [Chloroflexi bacterium]|nr:6-carboxytetrahydropterin synthase [Chloroflexota bacterium]
MSYEVGVVAQFSASHHLMGDFGPARLAHGHSYRVEVAASGDSLRAEGTLFDITRLQQAVAEVIADVDGTDLNDLPAAPSTPSSLSGAPLASMSASPGPPSEAIVAPVSLVAANPTAEVVARYFFERVGQTLAGAGLAKLRATVWESPEAYASYSGDLA